MSDRKRATLVELGPAWLLEPGGSDPLDGLDAAFGRQATRMLDIGVGTGQATLAWAAAHPDHDVLAVELHLPGVARLIADGHRAGLTNVRVIEADVTRLLGLDPPHHHTAPTEAFAAVRVLFPDPWPKKRHIDRRLVDTAFVHRVTDLLTVGGTLHLATDWPPYADQMRAAIAAEGRLDPQADEMDESDGDDGGETVEGPPPDPGTATGAPRWRSHRPDRPVTTYEQRGIDEGRPITDLIAHRTT